MRAVLFPVLAALLASSPAAAVTPHLRHGAPHHPFSHAAIAHTAARRGAHVGPPRRRGLPAHHPAATAAAAAAAAAAAQAARLAAAPAPAPAPKVVGSVTGLPLPRFASLRSDEVNLRSGPGTRYPIEWVYKKRDLPVEIEREYDVWRLVEDDDGTKGWVHQATLIGTRTFVVAAPPNPAAPPAAAPPAGTPDAANLPDAASGVPTGTAPLRRTAADASAALAYLKPGVIGRVVACAPDSAWCRVAVHGIGGFLRRDALWGVLPGETVGGG